MNKTCILSDIVYSNVTILWNAYFILYWSMLIHSKKKCLLRSPIDLERCEGFDAGRGGFADSLEFVNAPRDGMVEGAVPPAVGGRDWTRRLIPPEPTGRWLSPIAWRGLFPPHPAAWHTWLFGLLFVHRTNRVPSSTLWSHTAGSPVTVLEEGDSAYHTLVRCTAFHGWPGSASPPDRAPVTRTMPFAACRCLRPGTVLGSDK